MNKHISWILYRAALRRRCLAVILYLCSWLHSEGVCTCVCLYMCVAICACTCVAILHSCQYVYVHIHLCSCNPLCVCVCICVPYTVCMCASACNCIHRLHIPLKMYSACVNLYMFSCGHAFCTCMSVCICCLCARGAHMNDYTCVPVCIFVHISI